MDISQRLFTNLEEALNGKDFDHQVLGELYLRTYSVTRLGLSPQGSTLVPANLLTAS